MKKTAEWFARMQDALPAGYVIVPIEPTEAMLEAGKATFFRTYAGTATSTPHSVWKAMVATVQQSVVEK